MGNQNIDIIRVEALEADLPNTLIAGQLGFTIDTNRLGHLMKDGISMQWFASTEDSWLIWDSNGNGGITTDTMDGRLHIYSGSAGTVDASSAANELVLENSAHCGMTILAPDDQNCSIYFGSPSDAIGAAITYNHDSDHLQLKTDNSGAIMKFYTDASDLALTLDDSQNAQFEGKVHVYTEDAGAVTALTVADNVVIEEDDDAGLSILTPDANSSIILFGSPSKENGAYIAWNYTGGAFEIGANKAGSTMILKSSGTQAVYIDATQQVGIGSSLPTQMLDVQGNAIVRGHIYHNEDDQKNYYGEANDASINYDATNMVFNSQEVGSGDFIFNGGNVGIGSSVSPTQKLDVQGNIIGRGHIYHDSANQKNYFGGSDEASITYDYPGENMVFNSQEVGSGDFVFNGGNVGIDTATPQDKFHVFDIADGGAIIIGSATGMGSAGEDVSINFTTTANVVVGKIQAIAESSGNIGMAFHTYSGGIAEQIRINAAGDVGINVTIPTEKLHVDGNAKVTGTVEIGDHIRSTTSIYRRYYHLSLASFDPGLSGATWTSASANNLCGWQLNAAGETLEFSTDVHSDWDGASDMEVELSFQLLASGSPSDTVDLKLVCYYMGIGDIATKTQTVEVATVTDGTQYKMYNASFTIDHDAVSNVIDAGDRVCFLLNLETDTSEIDDVLIVNGSFRYNTTHVGTEDSDIELNACYSTSG